MPQPRLQLTRADIEDILWRHMCYSTPLFEDVPAAYRVQWNYDAEGWVDSAVVIGYNPNSHQPKEQEA
jgi:hypothetical protein